MIGNISKAKGFKGDKGDKGVDGTVAFDELTDEQKALLKGEPGPAGYTPQKGVDYFTPEEIEALGIDEKADKSTTLAGYGIKDAYAKTEADTKHEELQNQIYNVSDTANYAYGMAFDLSNSKADKTAVDKKADKTVIEYYGVSDGDIYLGNLYNKEARFPGIAPAYLNFIIKDGVYEEDYIAGVSFITVDTPPQVSYTNTGIIHWVGIDCSLDNDGYSLFIPSPNMNYDIVFYFNGYQFTGLVNGYKTAVENKGTAEAVSE